MRATTARTTTGPTRAPATLDSLPTPYWSHLRRVRWAGRPDLPVDHLLVGPSGIYVIAYATGRVDRPAVGPGGDGPGGDAEVQRCVERAELVQALLPPRYHDRVRPVWCVDGDEDRAEVSAGVLVVSRGALLHVARSSAPVLSTSEVAHASARLAGHLQPVPREVSGPRGAPAAALRLAAACVAVAAASTGVLALGPETVDLLGVLR